MKKYHLLAMMAMVLTFFSACQKDELKVDEPGELSTETEKPDVYVENGYLAFKDFGAVDSVLNLLNKMSKQERDDWDSQMGFKSASANFNKLFDEYEMLKSKEEFLAFKKKYQSQLTFNESDPEDCSIDYPFVETYYANILNKEGIMKVGKSIIKYNKNYKVTILDGKIDKLNNLSEYTDDPMVFYEYQLKSSSSTLIDDFPCDNPFIKPNCDRWWRQNECRLLNELRVDRNVSYKETNLYERSVVVYFKQRAQKDTWLGWKDYTTQYLFGNSQFQYGNYPMVTHWGGDISPEMKSASTKLFEYHETVYAISEPQLLDILEMTLTAITTCRGFNYTQYSVTYPHP